jgi:hypothetical protein
MIAQLGAKVRFYAVFGKGECDWGGGLRIMGVSNWSIKPTYW